MSDKPKPSGLALMRVEFPDHQISKLPKGGRSLDYVGHAALTDRLLDCDPHWHWEPMALTPEGLPLFDASGGLWIRLTVCGVTRLGYGHAAGKEKMDPGAREKEVIGDALRNAGMRFGAALALWHKGELHQEPSDSSSEDTSDFAKSTGEEWLKKFDDAKTLADVTRVSGEVKKAWDILRTIPGFSEAVVERRNKATARVRGYDNPREPGED